MRVLAAAVSDTGKVREKNEDNLLFGGDILAPGQQTLPAAQLELDTEAPCLLGVFDGMGGYAGGEKASAIAAEVAREAELHSGEDLPQRLREICLEANDAVCEAAEGSHMGTTAAMLCFAGNRYVLCNVGDSPVFLLRHGKLRQVSVDHNLRSVYEAATGKKADPKQKFRLTQCIGIPREEMQITPYVAAGRIRPGDVFLICSDGVTDMLPLQSIREILSRNPEPREMTAQLLEAALAAGGVDNITAICLKVPDGRWKLFLKRRKKD